MEYFANTLHYVYHVVVKLQYMAEIESDKETLVNKFSSLRAMGDNAIGPYKELQSIVVSEVILFTWPGFMVIGS